PDAIREPMINEAIDYIRRELRDYLGVDDTEVIIDNAHVLKDAANSKGAYISIVNVKEETALKNGEHYVRENNQVRYKEPPVYLNLYLLLSFEFDDYGQSLLRLSQAVELFQSKRVFSAENDTPANQFPATLEKLVFDFVNLNFEELNHLWGVLGGAYYPSVLYKVRLVKVQRDVTAPAPEIGKIQLVASVQ
ncbi:MAG: DUF4255 domain-containing protein, partial [Sphingomicrobium sp.]